LGTGQKTERDTDPARVASAHQATVAVIRVLAERILDLRRGERPDIQDVSDAVDAMVRTTAPLPYERMQSVLKVEFGGIGHSTVTEQRQQEGVDRVLAFFDDKLR